MFKYVFGIIILGTFTAVVAGSYNTYQRVQCVSDVLINRQPASYFKEKCKVENPEYYISHQAIQSFRTN